MPRVLPRPMPRPVPRPRQVQTGDGLSRKPGPVSPCRMPCRTACRTAACPPVPRAFLPFFFSSWASTSSPGHALPVSPEAGPGKARPWPPSRRHRCNDSHGVSFAPSTPSAMPPSRAGCMVLVLGHAGGAGGLKPRALAAAAAGTVAQCLFAATAGRVPPLGYSAQGPAGSRTFRGA